MKTTLYILLGISTCLVILLAYLGAFRSIEITEEIRGPFHVIYLPQKGDYRQVGGTTKRIGADLKKAGVINRVFYAVYYDDPNTVAKDQLRSEAGHVLEEPPSAALRGKLPETYRVKTIPRGKYLIAEFPLRNFLSIFMGIFRVYPRLFEEGRARGLKVPGAPSLEIYKPDAGQTIYMLPLETRLAPDS